ncbi:MAG: hypothetical protein ACLGHO_01390 [Gammaproteobacteria bacterium]
MTHAIGHSYRFLAPQGPAARRRLALVLLASALLHLALLSRVPSHPTAARPVVLEVSLDTVLPAPRAPAKDRLPRTGTPSAPNAERALHEPLRSIFDVTRDTLRTEIERGRRGTVLDTAPAPELPALGDKHQRPSGLVGSDRLAGGGTRYEYRDRDGKTIVWECPESNPNDSFALSLCRTEGWR